MILSLIAIAFLVFFNAINHPFVHDDVVFIVQNPSIASLDHWWQIFLHPSSSPAGAGINFYYRPILEIFYRLEYRLFGFNAAGYHLINIFIHIANGLLLFGILSRLQFSRWLAFGVSLLFLIHPVQTEAVACISGISNLLSTFFVLLTIYAYLKEKYLFSFLSFALALLTKEQVIIVPLVLILLDWYQQKKKRHLIWGGFILIAFGFMFWRGSLTSTHLLHDILQSPGELRLRMLAIPRTLLMDLRLIIAPYDIHYYRNTDILQPNAWGFVVLTGLLAGLIGLMYQLKINAKQIILGIGWFLIFLLPVLNIVPLVNEYSFIMTADHFLYLPMIGVLIVLALILQRLVSKQLLIGLAVLVCLGLGGLSIYQNTFWRGEIPLFERMIAFEGHFARGHILLGNAYLAAHQKEKAILHYTQALSIMQGYSKKCVNPQASIFYQGFINDLQLKIAQASQISS